MAGLNKAMTAPPGAYPEDVVPAVPPPVGPPPFEAIPPEMDPNSEVYQRMLADYMLQQALAQAPGAAAAAGRGVALGANDVAQEALRGALGYGLGTVGGVVGGSDPRMQDVARIMREQGISDLAPYAAGAAVGPGASAVGSKLGPYVLPAVEKTLQLGAKIPGATQAGKAVSAAAGPAAAVAGPASVMMSASGQGQAMDPAQYVEPLPSDVKAKQAKLKALGLYNGPIDGVDGGGTKRGESAYYKRQGSPEVQQYLRAERDRGRQREATAATEAEARLREAQTAAEAEKRAGIESKRQYYNEQLDARQGDATTGEVVAGIIGGAMPIASTAAGVARGIGKSRAGKRRMGELEDISRPKAGYIGADGRPLGLPIEQRQGFVDAYDKATTSKSIDGTDKAVYGFLGAEGLGSYGKAYMDKQFAEDALNRYYSPEGTPADAEAAAEYKFSEDLMRQFSNTALPSMAGYTLGKVGGEAATDAFTGRTKEPPFQATNAAETFRSQNAADRAALERSTARQADNKGIQGLFRRMTSSWTKPGKGFAGNKFTKDTASAASQARKQIADQIKGLGSDPQVGQRISGMMTANGKNISVKQVMGAYNMNRSQANRLINELRKNGHLPPAP